MQDTMFIQFFAGDYGMERCSFELRVPTITPATDLNANSEDNATMPSVSVGANTKIEVWRASTPDGEALAAHEFTWATRPARGELLATWDVVPNATFASREFECRSLEYQTFELACAPGPGREGCLVDMWPQTRYTPDIGV